MRRCRELGSADPSVYHVAVLTSISSSVREMLPSDTDPRYRLPSLFALGIHDIPSLEGKPSADGQPSGGAGSDGWVACTTDEIMASKTQLYDVVVEVPAADSRPRKWPTIKTSRGAPIRATQRDVWRYKLLRHQVAKHSLARDTDADADADDPSAPLLARADEADGEEVPDQLVEPMTWPQLAYSGFLWWASAGEESAFAADEREWDRAALSDIFSADDGDAPNSRIPTSIIAYFHRLTSTMVETVSELIRAADDAAETAEEQDAVEVRKDDMSRMGLDYWSAADKEFVEYFTQLHFGRWIRIASTVECCGLRM